jgi:NADH-quinone oxidoreductase subunit E
MLRRLYHDQPAAFAFTPANEAWARAQITKYPPGRQASAIIPLLWRAQEQEGWLSKPAIEHVAGMLGMAYIRALEVATFYFMFQLQPVGDMAHVQVCGTTSCMIMGAEDLIAVCKRRIAGHAHERSADGRFSWEEVECMGACANAPMAQIGKDYYEDLTPAKLEGLLDEFAAGRVPVPGPQNGRYSCEPASGLTSLKDFESGRTQWNGSAQRAVDLKDTVRRIDGTEEPLVTPWLGRAPAVTPARGAPREPKPGAGRPADATGVAVQQAPATAKGRPKAPPAYLAQAAGPARGAAKAPPAPQPATAGSGPADRPAALAAPRDGGPDDLEVIVGIGPKLARLLNSLGIHHFDQIAGWTAKELAWIDGNLEGFKGRASRDDWVGQARALVAKAKP